MFKVKLIGDGKIPTKGTPNSAGYDLYSAEEIMLEPWSRKLCSLSIIIEIDSNVYGRIAPRSGLSLKGIDIGAGVIDSDYRGIVKVLMINNSGDVYHINLGDRIAQLILEKIVTPEITLIEDLTETLRSEGGFGSTGV